MLSRALLAPPLRSVRWSATPSGPAHGTSLCRRGSAPIRSALARHGPRPLRSRLPSRARSEVPDGDPATPDCTGVPSTSRSRWRQAAPARREGRGAPSPQQTEGRQRLGSFVASGGPQGPPLRETVGSPFVSQGVRSPTVPGRFDCPPRQGRRAKPPQTARGPADCSGGRSDARALTTPLRCASRAAPCRLRLALCVPLLKSLHSEREPPGSLHSPIAPGLAPGANPAALTRGLIPRVWRRAKMYRARRERPFADHAATRAKR